MRKKGIITLIMLVMVLLAAASGPSFSFLPRAGGMAYAEEKTDESISEPPGTKLPARWDNKITRDVIRYLYSVGFPTATFSYALFSGGGPKRDYWKWSHDGFFGHGTPYGGFDKAINMFTHYSAMRLSCAVFNYTERGSPYRFLYGTLLTSLMGLSMEIVDAYMGSGFSY